MELEKRDRFTNLSSDGATLAKVIATFCVVLTHSYKLYKYMSVEESQIFYLRGFQAFSACGVPVFFLLSGYFLVLKGNWDYRKNLKKKLKSLVIPYCFFMIIYTFISCLGSFVFPRFFDDFSNFTLQDWLMHLVGIPFVVAPRYYGPLWFVRELLIFNVFSFVLVPIAKKIPGYILIPVMLILYFLNISHLIRYSVPFFVVGMHLGYKKKIPIPHQQIYIFFILFIGFFLPIIIKGELSYKLSVFLMAVTVIFISGRFVEKDRIREWARIAIPFSFPIYLLHEYLMTTSMKLLALKNIPISQSIIVFFLAPFIIIGICIIISKIWKRLLPKLFATATGGRQ